MANHSLKQQLIYLRNFSKLQFRKVHSEKFIFQKSKLIKQNMTYLSGASASAKRTFMSD